MTKTIGLELSKKLAPYLKDFETEYFWVKEVNKEKWIIVHGESEEPITEEEVKTLTFEEAIEFILDKGPVNYTILISYLSKGASSLTLVEFDFNKNIAKEIKGFTGTRIGGIETMLEYLLDNNLLGKQ